MRRGRTSPVPRPVVLALLLLLATALDATRADAQRIRIDPADRSRAAGLARDVLEEQEYLLVMRDTVLPDGFRTEGDLVSVDADVRLEGTVEGRVIVLGGSFFLRPGARVGGDVAVIGGGFYPSRLAAYGEVLESTGRARVRVSAAERDTADGLDPRGDPDPFGELVVDVLAPPGPRRLAWISKPEPTYDRVNGLTFSFGPRWRVTGEREGPVLHGWLTYFSERHDLGGGGRLLIPTRGGGRVEIEAARETRSNELWQRSTYVNSLASLLAGRDYHDHWESDRFSVTLMRRLRVPLVAGESWLGPWATVRVSQDRSLDESEPWSLTGELDRLNPAVEEATIASAIVGARFVAQGRTSRLDARASLEHAPGAASDIEFSHVVADAAWTATPLPMHEAYVGVHASGPVLGTTSPPQRRSILGGAATLPTLRIAELRGDRVVFVDGWYAVAVPGVVLPFAGEPMVEAAYATGTAWSRGEEMPSWTQNVSAGLRFTFVQFRVMIDPDEPSDPAFAVGVGLPTG